MNNRFFLVRHGASEWNELGLWTGWTDINLAPSGREEARRAAEALRGVELHSAHVSALTRAKQTLGEILAATGQSPVITVHGALNERHYGDYTGKNKWEVKTQIGNEAFEALRRGWDVEVPGGETLKMVHDRVVPYFNENILVELENGKNVIIAAHGNTLRALMKYLERIPDGEVHSLEVATGEVIAYEMTQNGLVREK